MRIRLTVFIIGLLLPPFMIALLSCAANKNRSRAGEGLPQSQLANYNDTFDSMREDLWRRAGNLWREERRQDFKPADMRFENGKLIIRTKTGGFSKGGLKSRYVLKGDFDIQIDFLMDFTREIAVEYMDQVFVLSVFDRSSNGGMKNGANIGLSVSWGTDQGYLFSSCFSNGIRKGSWGKGKSGFSDKIINFKGSFRIVRIGEYISTLHKEAGETEWSQKLTARVTGNDMLLGFQLRNFFPQRTTIRAEHPITVMVDRFTINAAHKIIKEKI